MFAAIVAARRRPGLQVGRRGSDRCVHRELLRRLQAVLRRRRPAGRRRGVRGPVRQHPLPAGGVRPRRGRPLHLRPATDRQSSRDSARGSCCRPRRAPRPSAPAPAPAFRTTTARRPPRATRAASPVSRRASRSASARPRSAVRSTPPPASEACAAALRCTAGPPAARSPMWGFFVTPTMACAATAPRASRSRRQVDACELSERLRRRRVLRRQHRDLRGAQGGGRGLHRPGARVRGRRVSATRAPWCAPRRWTSAGPARTTGSA